MAADTLQQCATMLTHETLELTELTYGHLTGWHFKHLL